MSKGTAVKWLVAVAALICAAPASPCPPPPPPPPGFVQPTEQEILRRRADRVPNIVYAVVERSIVTPQAAASTAGRGYVRILHAYKGALRAGQRIPMYAHEAQNDCDLGYAPEQARRGAYGVLLLEAWDGGAPLPFRTFEPPANVEQMIRFGIIESARARSDPGR